MMKYILCLVPLIVIPCNLFGCLILPLPSTKTLEEKPFQDKQAPPIIIGITTKEEVENQLGAPDATRRKSSVYIFAEPHRYGYLLSLFPGGYGGASTLEKHHLFIVQFDKNGIVKNVDHIVGNGSCTQNGICVADTGLRPKEYWSSYPKPEDTSIQQMLVLYSDSITESNAKNFIVPRGKSAIYLYREKLPFYSPRNPGDIQKVAVNLDNIELGDFGEEGFFYWVVDPGNHSITVTPLWPGRPGQGRGWQHASIKIECKEGQIYFVEQTWESKGFFLIEFNVSLTALSDQSKGRQDVLKRRMVLDCLSRID